MYNVTESYRAKMLDQVQTHKLIGTLDGDLSFTEADVIGVSYRNQSSAKNVCIGSVNIGTLKLTFLTDLLNRGEYLGKTITLLDSLYLGLDENEDPVWESVPLGTFYIAEAVWTAAGIDITAYDCLSKLDEKLTIDQTTGTIYSYCKYIEQETGVTFGMTEAQCLDLPNGSEVLSPYEENNMETFRDLLSALAQMIGGFGYAARDNTFKLRPFNGVSVVSVPKNRRMTGAKFSDFNTLYDTVSFYDIQEKMIRYVGANNGLVMNLDKNPFLQYGSAFAIERRALNIAQSIESMVYTPYEVTMLPAFIALDLGDVVSFASDFAGDVSSGAVMEMTWTYNKSCAVRCYGSNPALRSAQNRNDKNIAGIIKSTEQNEVTYYNFANLDPITFGSEHETMIASLAFTSAQKTTVKIMHEFIFDMLKDLTVNGSYEIRYYLDDELLPYSPYESLSAVQVKTDIPSEGEEDETYTAEIDPVNVSLCKDFFYVLRDVEPNQRHVWEVRVITHGIEETTIDTNHAHITLEGQRLYGQEYYDGFIDAKDYLTLIPIGNLGLVSMGDTALVSVTDPNEWIHPQVSDNFGLYDFGKLSTLPMAEGTGLAAPTVYMEGGFPWSLEDDDLWATEDGKRWVTE